MIDLKQLRDLTKNYRDGLMTMPVDHVIELLDMLDAAKLDAARWREAKTGRYFSIIDGCGDEVRNEAADEAIDVFLAATKGDQ